MRIVSRALLYTHTAQPAHAFNESELRRVLQLNKRRGRLRTSRAISLGPRGTRDWSCTNHLRSVRCVHVSGRVVLIRGRGGCCDTYGQGDGRISQVGFIGVCSRGRCEVLRPSPRRARSTCLVGPQISIVSS
jgi:hypothetical protein